MDVSPHRQLQVSTSIYSWHVGSGIEYLVKWKGLGYDECTWESLRDLLPKFKPEVDKFESQQPIANELIERQKSHSQVNQAAMGPATVSRGPCSMAFTLMHTSWQESDQNTQ